MSVTEVKPDTLEMERNVRSWFVVAKYNRACTCMHTYSRIYIYIERGTAVWKLNRFVRSVKASQRLSFSFIDVIGANGCARSDMYWLDRYVFQERDKYRYRSSVRPSRNSLSAYLRP